MTIKLYSADQLPPVGPSVFPADMQAAPGTQYSTGTLTAKDSFIFNPVVDIVNVGGGAAGSAKITLDSLDDNDNVIKTLDIVTAIPTNTADVTVQVDLIFGAGIAAALYGVGTLAADANKFKIMFKYRVILEVVVANDGTSSDASMSIEQEG